MDEEPSAVEAAAQLVNAKYAIDDERRRRGQQPVWPAAFIQYALPFADGGDGDGSPSEVTSVPANLVVGATWGHEWAALPVGAAARDLCQRLDDLAHTRAEPNWAILIQVGPLPLWYAWEGKNRVALYRALGRPLIAEVRRSAHPPGSDLIVRPGDGISGVSRKRLPQGIVPLPVLGAADLLTSSGAATGARLSHGEVERMGTRSRSRQAFLEHPW
jgi:hypothetical protein